LSGIIGGSIQISLRKSGFFLFFPLEKGEKGGFDKIKSPLTPLFQRGEIFFIPLRKRGTKGDLFFLKVMKSKNCFYMFKMMGGN